MKNKKEKTFQELFQKLTIAEKISIFEELKELTTKKLIYKEYLEKLTKKFTFKLNEDFVLVRTVGGTYRIDKSGTIKKLIHINWFSGPVEEYRIIIDNLFDMEEVLNKFEEFKIFYDNVFK